MNDSISATRSSVKLVGANGQVSLGKRYAGRQVLVEEREPGVWIVRTAVVIAENERWLHAPGPAASLQAAMDWAVKNPPRESSVDALIDGMNHGKPSSKRVRQALYG